MATKFSEGYLKYIQSDAWKKKAAERRKMDGNKCMLCGSKKKLQVHHLTYDSLMNEDVEHDLVTLCRDCHIEVHAIKNHILVGMGLGMLVASEKSISGLLEYYGITRSQIHQTLMQHIMRYQEILYISPQEISGAFTIPYICPVCSGFPEKDCTKIEKYLEQEKPDIWNLSRKFYNIATEENTKTWFEEKDFMEIKKGEQSCQ